MIGLECSDCGYITMSIEAAAVHEHVTDGEHGSWVTVVL